MQGLISCYKDTEAEKRHKLIEKNLHNEKKKHTKWTTILFLGAEDSGKTTFIEQLKYIINDNKYLTNPDERTAYIPRITKNTLDCIKVLIDQSEIFDYSLSEENQDKAQKILAMKDVEYLTPEIGELVKSIWVDPAIQLTFSRSSEYFIDDSAKFFFENIDRIAAPDYVPSNKDVLRTHTSTTNLQETTIQLDDVNCRLVEVGEQQSDRRKWIAWFENAVDAIFYFVDVSKYDAQVTEENSVNYLQSCISDFTEMWNFKWTQEIPVVLFFNKKDIFEEKLRSLPMNHYFLDYTGSDFDSAITYLHRLFRAPTEHLKNSAYQLNTSHVDPSFPSSSSSASSEHSSSSFSSSSSSLADHPPTHHKHLLQKSVLQRKNAFKKLQIHNICALDTDNITVVFNGIRESVWMRNLSA